MSEKFTPGPLQVVIAKNGDVAVVSGRREIIAEFFCEIRGKGENATDEALANATLYCASEGMLAALEAQEAYYLHSGECRFCKVGIKCPPAFKLRAEAHALRRAAIAKAGGR